MSAENRRNVKWVEGLRGITSVLVITTHMARAWDFQLFWPSDSKEVAARIWQYPILRVPFQGRVGVPIFAFLTGFVCAYKPLKLAYQQSNQPAALQSVARSAFRRPPRLILPAVIATLISFLIACLGGYKTANRVDAFWVRFDAPEPVAGLGEEVRRLFHTTLSTWTNGENLYDRHQWAMRPLLIGAFQVYVVLAATIGMRFRYRIVVHLLLLSYWLLNTSVMTETFGANLALGTLLAELSLHRPTQNFLAARARVLTCVAAPMLLIVGLFLGGFPHEHEDWKPWSWWLHTTFVDPAGDRSRGSFLVPNGADPPRRFSSACVQLSAIAIFLSPALRDLLSHRILLWLGKHSFAVYLVHGTILRTVGVWIVWGITGEPWSPAEREEDQQWLPVISGDRKRVAVVVFVGLTYLAAWAWMKWVDTACARATMWLEQRVFDDDGDGREGLAEKGHGHGPNGHVVLKN
ncbi:hypothetical protein DL546_006687 [Coniochaeta pulveracea]|uniref:Acyltransferase 3 domain-containing protein n=1 Tax=Coniochaeta pulveracea TaxID=177199 RepID=A0A420YJ30_9PEZI|nr:hypothetical protein DL546_006687 [Coniochaeta pulveracea]